MNKVASLGIFILILFSVFVPVIADDYSQQIGAQGDDAWESAFTTIDGVSSYHTLDNVDEWSFFRFTDVNISQSAVIQSASITLYLPSTSYDDADFRIYCHNTSDSWTVSGDLSNISNRAKTEQYIIWTESSIGTGNHSSPDVTTVIQELINVYGTIQDIGFIFDPQAGDTPDFRYYTWDEGSGKQPRLDITYASAYVPEYTVNTPTNSSIDQSLNLTNIDGFNVSINETHGYNMNITLETNESGSWVIFNQTTLLSNGTYVFYNTSWVDSYSTLYYWRLNITNANTGDSNISILHFRTIDAPRPQLTSKTAPSSGSESSTIFYFNVTYLITDSDQPEVIKVNITYGLWYDNSTVTWYEGVNLTGANYTYSRTLPTVGTYTYTFWADSGNNTNSTSGTVTVATSDVWSIYFPLYKELGDDIVAFGGVKNSTGQPLNNRWIYTSINDSSGTTVIGPVQNWITYGEYFFMMTTTSLIPGIHYIIVNFTDPETGIVYRTNHTIYIEYAGGPGHHSTPLYFHFYNANTGRGIALESFKLYVSNSPVLTASDRIFRNYYDTYTGNTIYYRVDDFFDNQVYPLTGDYVAVTITTVGQFVDIGVNWYDVAVKNLNYTILHFSMNNGSRYYNITLFPLDSYHLFVRPGEYNISLSFYDSDTGTYNYTTYENFTVSCDTFYIATGYDAVIDFSWYNTNEGLGLPDETLKLYIDDVRQIGMTFYTYINNTINVTVKDYYNQILYAGNFTITSRYTYIDMGLTFHSYKFCNKNDDYYIVSFLKAGASRWFEVGCCPYETINFMLPSGYGYTLRIYDRNYNEIYNETVDVISSMVYVIHGTNLSLIIQGQSIIQGQLLEVQVEINDMTTPDIVDISFNPPFIYSTYSSKGSLYGIEKVCPAQIIMADTKNITTGNVTSYPLIPANTTANGTIFVMSDVMYFEGPTNITWVNLSYINGTLIQNTSYIPSVYHPNGANIVINASNPYLKVTRLTRFQQIQKFYWTKYTDMNYYTATITFENVVNTTLTEVYYFIAFANDTMPDYTTARVKDVTNNEWLDEENYDASASGIHLGVYSMLVNTERAFTVNYYGTDIELPVSQAIVVLNEYGNLRTHRDPFDEDARDKNYYYLYSSWVNDKTENFVGDMTIAFAFDTDPYRIASQSFDVFDVQNSRWLKEDGNDAEFAFTGYSIQILKDTIGSVPPGGARTFEIYYLYISEDVDVTPEEAYQGFMNLHIFELFGWVFRGYHLLMVVFIIFGAVIPLGLAHDDEKKLLKRFKVITLSAIVIMILITFGYLQSGGTI